MIFPSSPEDNCTLGSLKKLRIDRPKNAGSRWKPIPHHTMLETVEAEAKRRSWKLDHPRCVLTKNKAEMAASWDVQMSPPPEKNIHYSIGVTNYLNQKRCARMYGGVRIVDREAGIPFSAREFPRATIHLDLEKEVREGINSIDLAAPGFPNIMIHLTKQKVTIPKALNFLMKATTPRSVSSASLRILTGGRLIELINLFKEEPEPEQHKWSLLVLFAQLTGKKTSPLWQMRNVYDFYQILRQ